MKYIFSITTLSLISGARSKSALSGMNEAGYTFIVRDGTSVIFDKNPNSDCSEAFSFPNILSAFGHSAATSTNIIPCDGPGADDVAALQSFITTNKVTALIYCSAEEVDRVKVSCFMDGVAISRRLGPVLTKSSNAFSSRVKCDGSSQDAALVECALSAKNMMVLKQILDKSTDITDSQASAPYEQPVEPTNNSFSQEEASTTEDSEERKLGVVSGRNQAGFSFDVMDGGIVTFLPRVGEECRESYIFDNLSTSQRYNAVARSNVVPCQPLPSEATIADIDPAWDIVSASVDCNDPVYISINCRVSLRPGDAPIELSRVAILQVINNRKYLSARIQCGAASVKEQLECASMAKNYIAISAHVAN